MRSFTFTEPEELASPALRTAYASLRRELDLPEAFPAEVLAEANTPADLPGDVADLTAIPFFTIDPPTAQDLDQAMFLERHASGFRVQYAIADIGRFIRPGGAMDTETWQRGQTVYLPDGKVPLHPTVLSEGAASLLPGVVCTAYVWQLELNSAGELTNTALTRALVRSVKRYDYRTAQEQIDTNTADDQLVLLREIGQLRAEQEQLRGGASLRIPDQEVHNLGDGSYRLALRPPVAAEDWNAQISLLTGMAAAQVMLAGGVGILRTLPDPDHHTINQFRRQAQSLGVQWPGGADYGSFLRLLNPEIPTHLALMFSSRRLFRGAGYTAFDGELPEHTEQAAVGAPYAHTTAPIRRLVDRYVLVVCHCLLNDLPIPDHVRAALPQLPEVMKESDRRANSADRRSVDIAEAALLADQVGATFPGVVVGTRTQPDRILVQGTDVPLLEWCLGTATLGDQVSVCVDAADVEAGSVVLHCTPLAAL